MTGIDVSHPPSSLHVHFGIAVIYRCLAPCKECTGNYISEMLQKQFICNCMCHSTKENNFGTTTPDGIEEGI